MADLERSIDPTRIASREFSSSFRGFDPTEVRNYLREVADVVRRLEGEVNTMSRASKVSTSNDSESEKDRQIAELEAELGEAKSKIAAAEGDRAALESDIEALKAAPIAPAELDESAITKLLGEETTRVLDSARQASADIVARSQAEADRRTAEIDAVQSQANQDVTKLRKDADEYAANLRSQADAETASLVASVTEEASATKREALEMASATTTEAEAKATKLVADAEEKAAAVLSDAEDEALRLTVEAESGSEAAKTAANEVAVAVKARAEEVARDTRVRAEEEAASIREAAAAELSDAQVEAARIRAEAEADAQTSADAAREETRLMVTEAQSVREKVLSDLVKRRRAGRQQVDQVKAARDRMARSLAAVKLQIDESIEELEISIPEAKRAMEEAARPMPSSSDAVDPRLDAAALATQLDSARAAGNPIVSVPTPEEVDVDDQADDSGSAADVADSSVDDDAIPALDADVSDELDGLFARIRQERHEAPAPSSDSGHEPDEDDLIQGKVERVEGEVPLALTDTTTAPAVTLDADAGDASGAEDSDEEEEEEIDPGPDFTARDVAITRYGADLRRKLKRALADDQSDVLDRLQQARRKMSSDDLADADEQIARYRSAAEQAIQNVAKAGAKHGRGSVRANATAELLDRIATEIVTPLRTKTERSIERADGEVDDALDAVRAYYRDVRSRDLPDLIEDILVEAFAIGVYASIPAGTAVAWITDPRVSASPDCFDNTFADDVVKPDEFPTGHSRPLGSPGCRCLVVART